MKTLSKSNFYIGQDCIENFQFFLKNSKYSKTIILTDENTLKFCYPILREHIDEHIVLTTKSGEENKSLDTCNLIWHELAKNNIDRNAIIVNLGGGLICDMGGFIASTFKRGIDFAHIPTTLLSMCDASIGGKLGVNLDGLKNYIGLFRNPASIFIYPDFLKTLPQKFITSGYAEIIKHALVADKRFFNEISEMPDFNEDIERLILRSIKIKSRMVKLDLMEKGVRKSLNFGHSIGHALESYFIKNPDGKEISHGEAVAAGMIAESFISCQKSFITELELNDIITLINKFFKKILFTETQIPEILNLINKDKKNTGADKVFSLIDGIGQCRTNEKVNDTVILDSLNFYKNL